MESRFLESKEDAQRAKPGLEHALMALDWHYRSYTEEYKLIEAELERAKELMGEG